MCQYTGDGMTAPTLTRCPVCGTAWDRDSALWPDDVCPDHEPVSVGTWDAGRLRQWLEQNVAEVAS